jgi:hypothetical protein
MASILETLLLLQISNDIVYRYRWKKLKRNGINLRRSRTIYAWFSCSKPGAKIIDCWPKPDSDRSWSMFIGSLMAHRKYLTTGGTHVPFGVCLTSVRNLSEALSKFQMAKWLISFPFRMLSVLGVCRTRMKIFLWQRLKRPLSPLFFNH